jgi:uncharacterized lipoprotein YmbA
MRGLSLSLLLLLSMTIAGCLTPTPPVIRYYLIEADESLPAQTPLLINGREAMIELSEVVIAPYLDRPQLVSRPATGAIEVAEFDQWGGALRRDLTQILARNLASRLATPRIHTPPHRGATRPDLRLEVEVMAFEPNPDDRVELVARWGLYDSSRRQLATAIERLQSEPLTGSGDYRLVVERMGQLYARLSDRLAQVIRDSLSSAKAGAE